MKEIDINSLVCPHIKEMNAYSSARTEYTGETAIFLDANENSLGSVTQTTHNRYPDPLQIKVKRILSRIEKLEENQIFLGNGSDECIDVLTRCFCTPKTDVIMTFPPVFSMYEHVAHVHNIEIEEVLLLSESFQLDIPKVLESIRKNPNLKIIFICSPNNPTGNLIDKKDIKTILENFNGLVVVDEAYQDFSNSKSWANRLSNFKNLVVIKTFSKAWGMADARIGMLFADQQIINYMNTIKMPYNVNQHSQQLAIEALNNIAKKDEYVQQLNSEKIFLLEKLKYISYIQKIYPSDANFIVIKIEDANTLYHHLIEHHIVVRNRDKAPLMKGCLRISIGTMEENAKLLEVLKDYSA